MRVANRLAPRKENAAGLVVSKFPQDSGLEQSRYSHCHGLNKSGWAWEFLRRNSDYQSAFIASRARLTKPVQTRSGIRILRPRGCQFRAGDWGLECFSDPSRSALETSVFWLKDVLKHCVSAYATSNRISREPADIDVHNQQGCSAILQQKHGNCVEISSGDVPVGLHLSGVNVLFSPVKLQFQIDGFTEAKHQSSAIEYLAKALARKPDSRSNNGRFLKAQTRQNGLLKALVALDCKLAGGSLKDTAKAFQSLELTRLSWSTNGDESLKKQVIRARDRGLKLMCGGYRSLL